MLPTILAIVPWVALVVAVLIYLHFWDIVLHGQAYFAGHHASKTREKELYRGGTN